MVCNFVSLCNKYCGYSCACRCTIFIPFLVLLIIILSASLDSWSNAMLVPYLLLIFSVPFALCCCAYVIIMDLGIFVGCFKTKSVQGVLDRYAKSDQEGGFEPLFKADKILKRFRPLAYFFAGSYGLLFSALFIVLSLLCEFICPFLCLIMFVPLAVVAIFADLVWIAGCTSTMVQAGYSSYMDGGFPFNLFKKKDPNANLNVYEVEKKNLESEEEEEKEEKEEERSLTGSGVSEQSEESDDYEPEEEEIVNAKDVVFDVKEKEGVVNENEKVAIADP